MAMKIKKYEENERSIKSIEEINQTQQPPWLVNNILFCYKGDKHAENES